MGEGGQRERGREGEARRLLTLVCLGQGARLLSRATSANSQRGTKNGDGSLRPVLQYGRGVSV